MTAYRRRMCFQVVLVGLVGCTWLTGAEEGSSRVKAGRGRRPVVPQINRDLPPPPPDSDFILNMALSRFPTADRKATVAFIQDKLASEMREIKELTRAKTSVALERMTDLVHDALELMQVKKEEPARFKLLMKERALQRKARMLAESVRDAGDEEHPDTRKALRAVLLEIFGVKQKLMGMEVEYLTAELEKLRVLVKKREENRAAIVDRRLAEVTGQAEYLKW